MTARIIDGKTIAAELRGRVADAAHRLARDRALQPGLAVVLVGNNPASEVYVGSKTKATVGSGMRSFDHRLPATVSEADLLTLVGRLNRDPVVHGILVQLPLPAHIDSQKILAAIDPAKDVDGFHPVNLGRLAAGLPALAPCTPLGCIILAKTVHAVARRARRDRHRPLQHRRQTARAADARRERHRDGGAFEDRRSSRGLRAAPISYSPRSAVRSSCARIGSSRAPP